jgi:deoxyribose-phosphate aldolase
MYIEFQCYDEILTSQVEKKIFDAIDCGVDGVSVPVSFLSKISNFIPEGMTLSCPIDYPHGFSDTDLRIHYAMKAVHAGANTLDVVASSYLFYHNKKEFINDIKSIQNLCKDKGIKLRFMVDCKKLSHPEDFLSFIGLISSAHINYIFCSTGMYAEDPIDNILLCRLAQDHYGFKSISNGNFYLDKHFKRVNQSKIFGIRFNNHTALKRCVSVYNKSEEQDLK